MCKARLSITQFEANSRLSSGKSIIDFMWQNTFNILCVCTMCLVVFASAEPSLTGLSPLNYPMTGAACHHATAHHDLWFIPFVLMRCSGSNVALQDLLCCGFWVCIWKSQKAPHRRGSLKVRAQSLFGCQIRPYRASKHLLLCGHTRRSSYHAIHQKRKRYCFFQWI